MFIKCLPVGMFGSNCYIVGQNGEGVVIDAGVSGGDVYEVAQEAGLEIKYIILTHGHIDHVCSVQDVRKKLDGAKVLIHGNDSEALTDPIRNGSAAFGRGVAFGSADGMVNDGDVIEAGGLAFEILHTPGHTSGGVCIKVGNTVFTGDTLFRCTIGRTDLHGGSYKDLIDSIKIKLMVLEDETVVYPGHGTSSTIGYERKNNPFLK